MKNAMRWIFCVVVGFALGAGIEDSIAQERRAPIPVGAIDEAAKSAGLPVVSVRCHDGRCEVVLDDTATPVQRVEAQAIEAAANRGDTTLTLSGGRTLALRPAPRLTLVDALAVLQVEPDDAAALSVVRARVAELRRGR